jgi:hypothetical protein
MSEVFGDEVAQQLEAMDEAAPGGGEVRVSGEEDVAADASET